MVNEAGTTLTFFIPLLFPLSFGGSMIKTKKRKCPISNGSSVQLNEMLVDRKCARLVNICLSILGENRLVIIIFFKYK